VSLIIEPIELYMNLMSSGMSNVSLGVKLEGEGDRAKRTIHTAATPVWENV